jgi:hypothetical protein
MIWQVDHWWAHMLRGDFAGAWQISDAVLKARRGTSCRHLPRHEQYIWDGTPVDGRRVLVRCYHGLGDTIQFARYAPMLTAVARDVTFWAQPPLIPLLATIGGMGALVPLNDRVPECDYDVDVEIMELPHVFRTTLETIPADVPYLHVEALGTSEDRMRVGIFWRVGDWDDRRAIPTSLLPLLADVPGVHLYMVRRDREAAGDAAPVRELPYPDDVFHTARMMRSLDLVITADSMPAHLAGALGIPAWTLLHSEPDWRWMEGRDDSPWYPTMRLFRQRRSGDWDEVVERVARELRQVARINCAT